ncbi:MAG: RraA family protein [Anaerolineae bacterium]|nr:RraA family protein [Anaerolineae bacterium]
MSITPATLEKLRKIDTPTICNVIELFDVRPRNTGYMDGRIVAAFPEMPPMVGFAATAGFRSAAPPRQGDAYASTADQVERFAELSGPAVVVFQDLDNPPAAATFGEVMCTTYKAFGAVGLITSGAGRDLQQVRALGFPVFTNGTICAHGYTHILNIMTPVHVGGIVVYPNDLLHGDCNGVTTIPHDIAADVADIADEFIAAEAIVLNAMREPNPTPQRLREAAAEMRSRVNALRTRVARRRP